MVRNRNAHQNSRTLPSWPFVAVILAGMLSGCSDRPVSKLAPVAPVQPPGSVAPSPPEKRRPAGSLPKFHEVARTLGIEFERYDDMRGQHRLMESNGGGTALLDYDGDGQLDVFFTDGCELPLREAATERSSRLYRQLGATRFLDATKAAGIWWTAYCYGCAVGDIDNDGFDDLYVTAFGTNRLWRNNGDGTFNDVTERAKTQVPVWSSSAAFADVNRDGNLDLYVTNYVITSDDPPELCPEAQSPDGFVACPPVVFQAEDDVLFLSDGQGAFIDITQAANATGVDGKGLGVVIFDANQDGWPDIYIANDGLPNFLFLNEGGEVASEPATGSLALTVPKFIDVANQYGAAVNQLGIAESSMGIAHGDADGDGWIDLLVTNFYTETNIFYRNLAGNGFADGTRASGLGPPSRLQLGFGAEFLDFDNNGSLDLMVANGHIDDLRWQPARPPYEMTPLFFRNDGRGHFEDVSAWSGEYFSKGWLGRGVASGDLDNDGDIDLAVSHQRSPSAVLRNEAPADQKSLVLHPVGIKSNRSAINIRIEAHIGGRRIVREIVGGGSYQSASDQSLHIGLGADESIDDLVIHWPSGFTQRLAHVASGTYLVREGVQTLWPVPRIPALRE